MRELKVRAEAADVAKSLFLAIVSHEIRTPMNGVLGMLQMLMDTDLDENQMDCAQTAHESGKDLISVINEVLDQAKIEFTHDKGHVFVSIHRANEVKNPLHIMDAVLREGFNLDQDMPDRTYNTLSGFPVSNRWKSWANFKKLNSINLIDEPEIIQLLVTVDDTSIGIPADAQSRIFTPFMQADSSTSQMYGGTGIGLSISKCLVDLMGGVIGFVSERGIGSTFSFTGNFRKGETTSLAAKWQNYSLFVICRGWGCVWM